MTRSSFWARITGKDKRKQYPEQQAVALGRVGNYTIAFPYGLYADVPTEALARSLGRGVLLPITEQRPDDTKQGEVVIFHPEKGSRIIMRNDGTIEIHGDVVMKGNLTVAGDTALGATVTSNGKDISDTHTHTGSLTAPVGLQSPTGAPV